MPYDRVLADMIRASLAHLPGVREVNMFGGLSFLVNEKIAVTASAHGDLMVLCDPAQVDDLLMHKEASPAMMGRRQMSPGWLRVGPAGIKTGANLGFWIKAALEYNAEETSAADRAKQRHRPQPM